ncbi:hypothetical protein KEM56_007811 [Ascosphaera pollenicola]|nr:hypothetical protein KEM56_007811 [Ascosphaera pollenicola]
MTSLFARTSTFPTLNGTEVYSLPPPGYHVNFDHPNQTQNAGHYAAFAIGIVVASVALIQRLYTKQFLAKGLQVDDRQVAVKALGVHVYEMPLDRFATYSKVGKLSL